MGSYTYNGDAPITGLTQFEYDKAQLGYLVRQEQQEQQAENARRGRKYSEPRRSTDEAMREFSDRHIN